MSTLLNSRSLAGLFASFLTNSRRTSQLGGEFTEGGVGRGSRRPTTVVGQVDNPFMELRHRKIARLKRSAEVIPKRIALTGYCRDRQGHESAVASGKTGSTPDPPHQMVRRQFGIRVAHGWRIVLHHLPP